MKYVMMSIQRSIHRISSRRTSVCAPPQLTFDMFLFNGNCSTYFTSKVYPELLSSFCYLPNCPYLPLPTINNLPPSVSRAVCAPPQLIVLILDFKFTILRGMNWSDLSPWPSCPSFPNPHV